MARGLHGRSEQLFLSISTRQLESADWRNQRDWAQASHDLLDLGDALNAYLERVNRLPPGGDGTSSWGLLDAAWAHWHANAANWGVSRAELIGCAPPS